VDIVRVTSSPRPAERLVTGEELVHRLAGHADPGRRSPVACGSRSRVTHGGRLTLTTPSRAAGVYGVGPVVAASGGGRHGECTWIG
jgi:hypothetical protein